MIYFVFSSSACNLSCSYCGGTPEDLHMPEKPQYDAVELVKQIEKDEDPVIVFYGGEPLLSIPFVSQVMDLIPRATFVLQSNCTLLHLLPTPYLLKFSAILVSIDGRPQTVGEYRGPTIYNKIVRNVKDAKQRGFTGHVIARMACSLKTDIYEDVKHLLSHELKFDSVYWQLDAQWDYPMNIRWGDFEYYLATSYIPGIQRLFAEFKESLLNANGDFTKMLSISPFVQILQSMVLNKHTGLRCSAGTKAVSITTDGRYLCCPVASDEDWNNIGTLKDEPKSVMDKVVIGGICDTCEDKKWCGGRCLYANHTMHWKEEGYKIICETVKTIIRMCEDILPDVKGLLADGKMNLDWFDKVPNERYSIETIP
ncbi:AstB/chuR-related_protein [Hexamita inflata]|uniref:AstB/chuR-related protein n=1 Tax=Hexamita inflata TaxID=28002 RepID=A0AA86PIU4_9EUKA|nr:AstB/chuR-related protein [Hexamita inflata]